MLTFIEKITFFEALPHSLIFLLDPDKIPAGGDRKQGHMMLSLQPAFPLIHTPAGSRGNNNQKYGPNTGSASLAQVKDYTAQPTPVFRMCSFLSQTRQGQNYHETIIQNGSSILSGPLTNN